MNFYTMRRFVNGKTAGRVLIRAKDILSIEEDADGKISIAVMYKGPKRSEVRCYLVEERAVETILESKEFTVNFEE